MQKPLLVQERLERQIQDLEALRIDIEDGNVPYLKGNTDPSYELPAFERKLIHMELVERHNDEAAKEYIEYKRVLKLHEALFMKMEQEKFFKNYDRARILHDGRIDAKEQAKAKVIERKKGGK